MSNFTHLLPLTDLCLGSFKSIHTMDNLILLSGFFSGFSLNHTAFDYGVVFFFILMMLHGTKYKNQP